MARCWVLLVANREPATLTRISTRFVVDRMPMSGKSWTVEELRAELERYAAELRAANMTPGTVQTYTDRAHRFVSWLSGDYRPQVHQDRA
jgi:hypothetical protein